jgi:hypothetical protein
MRPVSYPRDMAVLHRIEMDVIDVTREIAFVAQRVLPITALPDAALALAAAAGRNSFAVRRGGVMGFASLYPSYN